MRRIADFCNRPVIIRRANGWFVIAWLGLMLPTFTIWRSSVLWVAVLSIWANIISHYTAWLAARVEVRAEDVQDSVGHQITTEHLDATEQRILDVVCALARAQGIDVG